MTPRPPGDEPVARAVDRRLRTWLVVVTVIALAAAGGAGYAISQIENTKDENRKDDRAVSGLRADQDVLRQQLSTRLDTLETRVGNTAGRAQLQDLQTKVDDLDKKVTKLDKQTSSSSTDDLSSRLDDLENRVTDLQNKK